jgi:hypothetical protein
MQSKNPRVIDQLNAPPLTPAQRLLDTFNNLLLVTIGATVLIGGNAAIADYRAGSAVKNAAVTKVHEGPNPLFGDRDHEVQLMVTGKDGLAHEFNYSISGKQYATLLEALSEGKTVDVTSVRPNLPTGWNPHNKVLTGFLVHDKVG